MIQRDTMVHGAIHLKRPEARDPILSRTNFFSSTGVHLQDCRRKWLSLAFVLWAKAHSLSMVFCLGWDSTSLQELNAELEVLKQLVVELARRDELIDI